MKIDPILPDEQMFYKKTWEAGVFDPLGPLFMQKASHVADLYLETHGNVSVSVRGSGFQKEFCEHLNVVIEFLQSIGFLTERIPLISSPFMEDCVRLTLQKKPGEVFGHHDVRKAIFISLAVPLRQTVGSCFATSVLIALQRGRIDLVFQDLWQLLFRGSLRREIDGTTVQFLPTTGTSLQNLSRPFENRMLKDPSLLFVLDKFRWFLPSGHFTLHDVMKHGVDPGAEWFFLESIKAIAQPPLLKCWEYTASSFVDAKLPLSKTKLLVLLGLHAQTTEGLLSAIFQWGEKTLEDDEKKASALTEDLLSLERDIKVKDAFFQQTGSMETMKRLGKEIKWEAMRGGQLVDQVESIRKTMWRKKEIAEHVVEKLQSTISHYFCDLYDPAHASESSVFTYDAKAAFSLVYKSRNQNPLAWQKIHSPVSLLAALHDYLQIVEEFTGPLVRTMEEGKFLQSLFTLMHEEIEKTAFLDNARSNLQTYFSENKIPIEFENIWTYRSGGSLDAFLQSFLPKTVRIEKETIDMRRAEDLLFHLLERMKGASVETERAPCLFTAKQHAFIFQPHHSSFRALWEKRSDNTYAQIKEYKERSRELFAMMRQDFSPFFTLLNAGRIPLTFADTNWPYFKMAFQYNPEIDEIDLWVYSEREAYTFTSWVENTNWTITAIYSL